MPVFSQNYRCVTFDHRGWGVSGEPSGGQGRDAFVDDLTQLLDHLQIEKTFLVAQSMGGRACLGFALAHPERTLGLVRGDTTCGVTDPAIVEALRGLPPSPQGLNRALSSGFVSQHPNRAFLYAQIGGLNPPPLPSSGNNSGPQATDLERQPVPTLLIVGEEDLIAPVPVMQALQGLIPGSRLELVPGAAHSTYFEQPAEFNRLVGEFLAQIKAGAAAVRLD